MVLVEKELRSWKSPDERGGKKRGSSLPDRIADTEHFRLYFQRSQRGGDSRKVREVYDWGEFGRGSIPELRSGN